MLSRSIYTFLLILVGISVGYSQAPAWTVTASDYEFSTSFSGVVIVNDEESADTDDRIAAFVGSEVRGVATPFFVSGTGRYHYNLLVYSDISGEDITFSYYNATDDEVTVLANEEVFVIDQNKGSFSSPYIFYNQQGAKLTAYEFTNVSDESVEIDNFSKTVEVNVPDATDVTALITSFTFEDAPNVQVNSVEQQSGTTSNDFTNVVAYDVTTASGSETWEVSVSIGIVASINNISISTLSLSPNPVSDHVSITGLAESAHITILDLNGVSVLETDTQAGNQLDLSDLKSGLYVLNVYTEKGKQSLRLIK